MTTCVMDCNVCTSICEGYGCYDAMSVAENKAIATLEAEIDEMTHNANLDSRSGAHTEEEMDEVWAGIKAKQGTLMQAKGFLGVL